MMTATRRVSAGSQSGVLRWLRACCAPVLDKTNGWTEIRSMFVAWRACTEIMSVRGRFGAHQSMVAMAQVNGRDGRPAGSEYIYWVGSIMCLRSENVMRKDEIYSL